MNRLAARHHDRSRAPVKRRDGEHIGPAVTASRNVLINHRRAVRMGDKGVDTSPKPGRAWAAADGASCVLINDRLLHRRLDHATHGHEEGYTLEGSPDVLVGDYMGPTERHPAQIKLRLCDVPGPNGIPLSNTRWRLLLGLGAVETGTTDEEGNVNLVSTLVPETNYWLCYRGRKLRLYVSPSSDPASPRGIKIRLAFLGYTPGRIDNQLDLTALRALQSFQTDSGLTVSQSADRETTAALAAAAGF